MKEITVGLIELKQHPEFTNYYISKCGKIYSTCSCKGQRSKYLKQGTGSRGHLYVSLRKNKKTFYRYSHRLVLETYCGECPYGMECRHLNGDPSDNRLENLKWGTKKKNGEDRVKHGVSTRGEKSGSSKLKENNVIKIKILLKEKNLKQREIANMFGVARQTISDIKRKKTWYWI